MSKTIDIIDELTPRDKVVAYLQSSKKGEIHLTEQELTYMEKLDYCDDVIRAHAGSDKELINMVAHKYDITTVHARKLIQDARYVHGSMAKPVRIYERMRINEILQQIILKRQNTDPEMALKAIDQYVKLNRLDDTSLDVEMAEETGAQVMVIQPVFMPELLGVELPENIDEVIKKLRQQTAIHKKAIDNLE